MRLRRLGVLTLTIFLVAAAGCRKEKMAEKPAATAAAAAVGSYNADAVRAENLLKASRVPFVLRYDLMQKKFPEGCGWHATYATQNPEVVLEVFGFVDDDAARPYITARNLGFDALQPHRAYMVVRNGRLVLVAHYDPADRGAQKYDYMSRFVAVFGKA